MGSTVEKDQIMTAQQHENASPEESGSEKLAQAAVPTIVDGAAVQDIPKGYFRSRLFLGTYFAVAVNVIAGTGGFTYVAGTLNIINADIGPDPNFIWVGYTYTLCSACTFCLVGRCSDLFGRRWVIVGGAVLAFVGAILASQAQSITVMIIAMTIQAVASSTQVAFQFVLGELVPIGKRFIVMSTIFAWSILGGGIGISIGILFATHTATSWRGAFYFLAALDILAFILLFLFYHPPTFHDLEKTKTKRQVLMEFDYLGLILFTGGFFVFLMGLSWGGSAYPWDSAHVIASLVVGVVVLGLFVAWEWKANLTAPFMPFYLFRNLRWVAMTIALGIGANQFYAMALVWPQMVKSLWPVTGDGYAWIAAVPGMCLIVGQTCGGFLANFINPRFIIISGTLVGTAFIGGAACANENNFTTVLILVVLGYFMIGFQEAICGTLATISLRDQRDIGTGGGLAATMRSGISALGSAVYGAVLRNSLSKEIPKVVPAAAIAAGLPASSVAALIPVLQGGAQPAGGVPGLTPEILEVATHAYRAAASIAFRNVMLTSFAFGTVSMVCAWFAPAVDEAKKGIVSRTLRKHSEKEPVEETREKTVVEST